jgi:hypothetical protein
MRFTPGLVFSYFGNGIPTLKLLPMHDGADCEVMVRAAGYFKDDMRKLGPFVLLYNLLVDLEEEVAARRYHIELYNDYELERAADWGAGGDELGELRESLAWSMCAELEWTAALLAAARYNKILRMAATFQAQAAAVRIEAAYLSWKFRKEVLWNPNTELGGLRLRKEAERELAESAVL